MDILPADFADPRVRDLLHHHYVTARAATVLESAHALDLTALQAPEIGVWAAWDGQDLMGLAALKRLSSTHGEVKSMHTAGNARRRGVARSLLDHLARIARNEGLQRLSLETGSSGYFRPAYCLYKAYGFVECPPFADYKPDPNSVFMTLDLAA